MIAQKIVDAKHSEEPRRMAIATANLLAPAFWAALSNHEVTLSESFGNQRET
jgi:hypothetical protein